MIATTDTSEKGLETLIVRHLTGQPVRACFESPGAGDPLESRPFRDGHQNTPGQEALPD